MDLAKKSAGRLAPVAILLLWAVLIAIIAPWGEYPVNDDWVYGQAVQHVLAGRYQFDAPASANVFLQIYWGALFAKLFGFSYQALRWSGLIAGAGTLLALYALAREVGADRRLAGLTMLLLAVNPMFVALAASFMTDVPFIALTTLALFLFVRGARRDEPVTVALSFVALIGALLIRQHALLFIAAFGAAWLVRCRFSAKSWLVLTGAVVAGLIVQFGYQHWVTATGRSPSLLAGSAEKIVPKLDAKTLAGAVVKSALLWPYLGLMAAPMLLATRFAGLRALWRARPLLIGAAFVLIAALPIALIAAFHLRMPYYGNLLNPYGIGPLTVRDAFILTLNLPPEPLAWHLIWIVGAAIGVVAAAAVLVELAAIAIGFVRALVRRGDAGGDWIGVLVAAIVILYLGLTGVMSIKHNAFDRYLLPLVPSLALLYAHRAAGNAVRLIGAGIMLAIFALYSAVATHDYFAFQRARLAATDALEAAQVAPRRIDAGYEYSGWRFGEAAPQQAGLSFWAVGNDYVVSLGPLMGYEIVARHPYRRWLSLDGGEVVTLKRTAGPVDPESAAAVIPGATDVAVAPCRLWLAGRPTCPRQLIHK